MVGYMVGVEDIKCVYFFIGGNKFDWFVYGVFDGKCCIIVCIVIEFGQYYIVVVDLVIEGFGCIYCILFGYRVYYKQCFIRLYCFFDVGDFFYYFFVN